jgi:hypothetical protein
MDDERFHLAFPLYILLENYDFDQETGAVVLVYFWEYCSTGTSVTGPAERRIYQHEWQGRLFSPAAKVESVIRRNEISVEWLAESPFP